MIFTENVINCGAECVFLAAFHIALIRVALELNLLSDSVHL